MGRGETIAVIVHDVAWAFTVAALVYLALKLAVHVEPPPAVERAQPCGERGDRAEKLTRAVA